MNNLQYLFHHQIDKIKWDKCIEDAFNTKIYAYSFYLDNMAKNWDAIIFGNYEAVMPLTWNKKFGIRYLYTPPFIQHLGIFSTIKIDESTINNFVALAKQRFKFSELFVNFKTASEHPNFILPLNKKYTIIQMMYKDALKQNLKASKKNALQYKDATDFNLIIDSYRKKYASRMLHLNESDFTNFKHTCIAAKAKNMLLCKKVLDVNNNLLASTLFLKDTNRLYNLVPVVSTLGRQLNANHHLLNALITEYCNQPLLLDFEGSSLAGIAKFYKKFGAINEPYYFLKYNNLPWPIKYFK